MLFRSPPQQGGVFILLFSFLFFMIVQCFFKCFYGQTATTAMKMRPHNDYQHQHHYERITLSSIEIDSWVSNPLQRGFFLIFISTNHFCLVFLLLQGPCAPTPSSIENGFMVTNPLRRGTLSYFYFLLIIPI